MFLQKNVETVEDLKTINLLQEMTKPLSYSNVMDNFDSTNA